MVVLYVDLENGNDNYAGSSFSLLASGTDGRITSSTFSAAAANFPNDGSLVNQYLSIYNGTIYAVYQITAWVSATSLTITAISGGTALANQAVDRQYYIGGRWKTVTSGATGVRIVSGDTVRIMGSPAPTSLGVNGTWTSGILQDYKSNVSGATNASPIAITLLSPHGYSTGDTIAISGVGGNTAANGVWEITVTGSNTFTLDGSTGNGTYTSSGYTRKINNCVVRLASAVTANIASTGPGRAAWTSANANVTTSLLTTSSKEHSYSDQITINTNFTTGLAAYWPTGTLDLSGYQQVSFWIYQSSGTVGAAGSIDLRLCSDTAGATAVNTVSVPNLLATGGWYPVTVDLGTNLGSSIKSIALYVNTNVGARTFRVSNVIACKASSSADSLTLTSLIGKNTTGETWWGIQSINGTRVILDSSPYSSDSSDAATGWNVRGYYGTSETVTTWKRETIKNPINRSASTTVYLTLNKGGVSGSPVMYSGGWDRTSMSTQNLETWVDGLLVGGTGLSTTNSSYNFISVEKIAAVRFNTGFSSTTVSPVGNNLNIVAANNNDTGVNINTSASTITIGHVVASINTGINLGQHSAGSNTITCNNVFSTRYYGFSGSPSFRDVVTINVSNAGLNSVNINGNGTGQGLFLNCRIENNTYNSASFSSSVNTGVATMKNCLLGDSTEVDFTYGWTEQSVNSHDHDQTSGNHKIFKTGGLISASIAQRHTASGVSWMMQPTNAATTSIKPLVLPLAKVACAANSLVTVKAWMYRNNSGLSMRLVCKGGQIAGVANDVTSTVSATNAWEEETITFTPTEAGVVEIVAEAWGGTTNSGWVDDMTITQA